MTKNLLEAKDFSPSYADLTDDRETNGPLLSLSLPPQTITAVMGAADVGVSAWLAGLAGVEDPHTGCVSVLGQDLAYLDKHAWQLMRTKIAYLGKHTRLMSVLSVLDNIVVPALYHKLDEPKSIFAKAKRLLAEIESFDMSVLHQLPDSIDRHTYGWTLIVRALLLKPKVVILDNFFRAYTKNDTESMLQFICSKVERQSMAALLYHHDLHLLLDHSTASIFIGNDSIIEFQNNNELLQCKNEEVIDFLRKNDMGPYE
ncbi:MAG: ATP-binding cassette domain-containing protein [Gammaproteobacteria bacterium]|nr:ATP-binding cassette domain-containing protein [Gammaproteobacteria bacterium]